MRYIDHSIGSAHLPKLLGIYERELSRTVEAVLKEHPKQIIVLGAAEGYYAVGLALRNPGARIVAFEKDAEGRTALAKMAHLNNVEERMVILGECQPQSLQAVIQDQNSGDKGAKRVLVVCDVEGAEADLLNPSMVPGLRAAIIIVETHEFLHRGITGTLVTRFLASHEIEHIWQTKRTIKDFPFHNLVTRILPRGYLAWAVSEWRPEQMCWLSMRPLG
jgi:hypothetical protein